LHSVCSMISGVASSLYYLLNLDPNAKVALVKLTPKIVLSAFS
jgi:hypothetical protein